MNALFISALIFLIITSVCYVYRKEISSFLKKHKKHIIGGAVVATVIGSSMIMIPTGDPPDSPYGGIIDGDSISWENSYARLEVFPHTSYGLTEQIQFFNFTWKLPDNTIDIAFRFPFELDTSQADIWLWQNKSFIKEDCDLEVVNGKIERRNCSDVEVYRWSYVSYKNSFEHVSFRNKEYYYITDIPVKQGKTYHGKWMYNTPIGEDGKWDLMAKLSSDSLGYALDNDRYVLVDPWWDSSWDYYKVCNIENKYDDYQMRLFVGYESGGNVSCNGNANSDFGDIRFIRTDNTTELSYWLENYTDGDQATFWVNNSGNDSQILMYYGNSDASTTSDGEATFLFFDDAETGIMNDKWAVVNASANAYARYSTSQAYQGSKSILSYDNDGSAFPQFENESGELMKSPIGTIFGFRYYGTDDYDATDYGSSLVSTDLGSTHIIYYYSGSGTGDLKYYDGGLVLSIDFLNELSDFN